MKRNLLLRIIFLLFFFGSSYSQLPFQKKYESTNSSRVYSIINTYDGGYIVAGSYDVLTFLGSEYYVVKLDVNGDTIWANTYGSTVDTTLITNRDGSGNEAYDIIQTYDSGYLVIGEAHAFTTGTSDIFAVKLTNFGDTLWTKTYGGINSDYSYKVIQLSDSGYILSGYTESYGLGIRDAFVVRINKLGDTIWAKSYGGNSIDGSRDMIQTKDGGFILVGTTYSFGAGGADVYVIKMDANGYVEWSNAYGGILNDFGNTIIETSDSNFVISGSTESFGSGRIDVYVIKIDTGGNVIWSKAMGGIENESGKSILELANKELVVFGNTTSFGKGYEDFYLIKLNSLGGTIFSKVYGGISIDIGESIKQTADKGFIMAGYTNSFNTWSYNAYIVKTDSIGNSGCHQSNPVTLIVNPITVKTSAISVISPGSGFNTVSINIGKTLTNPIDVCNVNSIGEMFNRKSLIVYPNPTHNFFSIMDEKEITGNSFSVILMDIQGKIIKELILNGKNTQIDISNFEKGVYFASIETSLGRITKKIIKD